MPSNFICPPLPPGHPRPGHVPVAIVPTAPARPRPKIPVTSVNGVPPDENGDVDVSIPDIEDIRAGAAKGATAYQLPETGVPKTDLAGDVRASLGKADTALQEHQDISGKANRAASPTAGNLAALTQDGDLADSGKKPADFATAAQGAKADTAVQPGDLPEKLPNPQALKFVVSSIGVYDEYDGSSGKTIGHASANKFGLVRLSDRTDYDRTADNGAIAATPAAVKTVNDKVTAVEGKIPAQASASNQLADKDFVNSSIATETATFRGTFNLVTDLELPLNATHEQVAAAVKTELGQTDYDKHDYVFVQIPQDLEHTDAMKQVDRYKCVETGTDPVVKSWEYEWTLNNSSFTAAQWAAVNSGITSGAVAKLGALPTAAELAEALAGARGKLDLEVYDYPVTYGYWTIGEGASEKRYALVSPGSSGPTYKWVGTSASTDYIQYNSTSGNIYRKSGASGATFSVQYPGLDPTSPATVFPAGIELLGGVLTYHPTVVGSEPVPTGDTLAKKSESVPASRTVNGKALSSDVTLTGADIAVSGSDPTKIDAALAGKATKADATLAPVYSQTPTFGLWTITRDGIDVTADVIEQPSYNTLDSEWVVAYSHIPGDAGTQGTTSGAADATSLGWTANVDAGGGDIGESHAYVATRTRTDIVGYTLGSQTDKPLASEAEAEALRTALADKANDADVVHKSGDTMTGMLTLPKLNVGGNNTVSGTGGATAQGFGNTSSSYAAHAEGVSTRATGQGSHTEGAGTSAQNDAEHAQGRYNSSHKQDGNFGSPGNTLSSIGFGTADNARKNAVETMQDGKTFIYGLGGYDGTNPTGNGVKDIAAAVNGKASTADATLTERTGFSAWTILRGGVDVTSQVPTPPTFQELGSIWLVQDSHIAGDSVLQDLITGKTSAALSLSWAVQGPDSQVTYTATRTALSGYQLGSQSGKPLASEAEVEALRNTTVRQVQLSTASQGADPISPVDGLVTLPVSNSATSSSGTTLASSKAVKTVYDAKLDKTAVVAPSTSASDSGKAADAKATGDALAARPTKADIDAGWWSDWVCEPATFTPEEDPSVTFTFSVDWDDAASDADPTAVGWALKANGEICDAWYGDENSTRLELGTMSGSVTEYDDRPAVVVCSRHRVAAPVPTKPGDIGAQAALSAQQLADIAAVPNKAAASDLPYDLLASVALTVSGGAASMTLADRTHNVATVAAPGTGNTTTITLTLPAIVSGKSRGMFFNLTAGTQASDAGDISIVIVEPSGATAQIEFGGTGDVGIGKNEILISENAAPTTSGNTTTTHWLVTVRHEDFAS